MFLLLVYNTIFWFLYSSVLPCALAENDAHYDVISAKDISPSACSDVLKLASGMRSMAMYHGGQYPIEIIAAGNCVDM